SPSRLPSLAAPRSHPIPPPFPTRRSSDLSIFDQPDKDEVCAQFDRVLEALWDKLPRTAEHLEGAREDILAFASYPKEIWRQIWRSEEHTSELQSRFDLVCRLLLEKKNSVS